MQKKQHLFTLLMVKSNLSVSWMILAAFALMHLGGDKWEVAKPNRELFRIVFLWTYYFCAPPDYLCPVFIALSYLWGWSNLKSPLLGHHLCCHLASWFCVCHGEWAPSEAAPARKRLFLEISMWHPTKQMSWGKIVISSGRTNSR